VLKSAILVNGAYPGPIIEANWGDFIEVNVHNDICGPEEPTSIHWHGLNMPGTPWADGIPITSHCPITPGQNLTYRFRADEYGTSWYHSHVAAQYNQGIVGPIVIYGPSEHVHHNQDLGPVLVTDWYHQDHTELLGIALGPGTVPDDFRPLAESNLLAGVGRYACANITDGSPCTEDPAWKRWSVETGKTYRMRFVNSGSVSLFTISLDGHKSRSLQWTL
jgi:FtsP/CotA-like multicopper oxidase with cupredoxin domain